MQSGRLRTKDGRLREAVAVGELIVWKVPRVHRAFSFKKFLQNVSSKYFKKFLKRLKLYDVSTFSDVNREF